VVHNLMTGLGLIVSVPGVRVLFAVLVSTEGGMECSPINGRARG
jgi:hypothetical protein